MDAAWLKVVFLLLLLVVAAVAIAVAAPADRFYGGGRDGYDRNAVTNAAIPAVGTVVVIR